MKLKVKLLPLLILFATHSFAQKNDSVGLKQYVLEASYHSGFIFAHSIHVQDTKGVKPDGIQLEYSHIKTDSATHNFFRCYPRTGFALTYVDYNKDILGKAYSASYFIEPNYLLGKNLRMNVRASAGLSYLTNPHDSIKNPTNQSYSGHINSFLHLGLGFAYPVSKHFALFVSGNFFHDSNGGFKQPNAGVNYINASIGLQYFEKDTHLPVYQKQKDTTWKHEPLHYEISAFYSPKTGYTITKEPKRKYVAGANFNIVKRVGNIDAISISSEIYYDEGMHTIKKNIVHDNSSATLAGVLIGHQFLLNRFTFSQQLGVYVFKQTKVYNTHYQNLFHTIYHRWGIYYNINKHYSAGVTLLAHNQIADFIDARVIYRIK